MLRMRPLWSVLLLAWLGLFSVAGAAAPTTIQVVRTAQGTADRLTPQPSLSFGSDFPSSNTLSVFRDRRFQAIIGFGGAFTEAAALNWMALTADQRQKMLELYYGEDGIGYTIGRVPMNSCDFSVQSYSFDEVPGDMDLTHFDMTVQHDQQAMIPLIKAAQSMLKSAHPDRDLRLFLSPWSPPAWMKLPVNGERKMTGSATPVGLDPQAAPAWALYYSKFIEAYRQQGLNFTWLTVQNEPEFAAPWEACVYTAESQRDFIKNFLGPVIARDHPDVQIMAYDHNRDHVATWASVMYQDPETAHYVAGLAVHWYVTNAYYNLDKAHAANPSKFILNTEACNCPPKASSWDYAEAYAADMLNDLNHWVAGFVDWNQFISTTGGPNHLENWCDAPIQVDTANDQFHIQPSYYYIGHVTKFMTPQSQRVGVDLQMDLSSSTSAPHVSSGDNVFVWKCDGSPRQRWWVPKMVLDNSNMCMDIQDLSQADGANVQSWECSGGPNQQWSYDPKKGFITSKMNGKCLFLGDYGAGSPVVDAMNIVVRQCDSRNPASRWIYDDATKSLKSAVDSSFCATASGPMVTAAAVQQSAADGGQLVVTVMNQLDDQSVVLKLLDTVQGSASVTLLPHSIQTLIYS